MSLVVVIFGTPPIVTKLMAMMFGPAFVRKQPAAARDIQAHLAALPRRTLRAPAGQCSAARRLPAAPRCGQPPAPAAELRCAHLADPPSSVRMCISVVPGSRRQALLLWKCATRLCTQLPCAAAHAHALYTGDLSLLRQRYEDIKKHSFVYYYDEGLGLVNKPPAFMGSSGCKCPEAWSPAGLPPGVYEALQCTCTDLNDWPRQYQDGYQICNVSTVANSYIAMAA